MLILQDMLIFPCPQYDQEKFSEGYADLQWAAGKSTPGGAGGRGRRKGRNNRPGNQQLQEETMDVSALDDFTNGLTRELEAFDGKDDKISSDIAMVQFCIHLGATG